MRVASWLRFALAVASTGTLIGCLGASPAAAAEPWWQLSSSTRPSNFAPGAASDEVQEVTLTAHSGSFALTVTTGLAYGKTTIGSKAISDVMTTQGAFRLGDTITASLGKEPVLPANTTITAISGEALTASAPATSETPLERDEMTAQETSAAVPAGASAAELEAALTALPGVGAGNVEVTGAAGGPYLVSFQGAFADMPIPVMSAGGTAGAHVSEVTRGQATGEVALMAENLGDAAIDGSASPVEITDTLPAGYEAIGITGSEPGHDADFTHPLPIPCSLATLTCTFSEEMQPYDDLEVRITVRALPGASAQEANRVEVSGGGAPVSSLSRPLRLTSEPSAYGVEDWRLRAEEEGGGLVTEAGSHPFQVTGTVNINQGPDIAPLSQVKPIVEPVVLSKDIITKIPAGLIGDPVPLPQCNMTQFSTEVNFREDQCPQQDAIGVASVTVHEPSTIGYVNITVPIFNLEPYFGEPARFGFFIDKGHVPVVLDTALREGPGEDYGINVISSNISELAGLMSARVTFWGVPDDPRHDNSRGWECLFASRGDVGEIKGQSCEASKDAHPPAFLTMPTSCDGPMISSAEADSWQAQGAFDDVPTSEPLEALDGCNQLPFAPIMSAEPTTDRASAPSGLNFNLDFKDEGLTSAEGIAQSQLNKTVVTLPEGLTINPSAGVGLGGCTPEDYARETIESEPGAGCPNDSKLGTVEIETPLLTQKIHGDIFIAQPYENPFDSLVALYIVAKNPEVGVLIKLAGRVEPNLVTGQLTTIFENNPQLAFSHFNFHFREGQQAPLISPPTCGTYSTQALLSPWSQPSQPVLRQSSFQITKGYDGGACPAGGVPPFSPGIESGMQNNSAGSYSGFYLHLTRTDAEQEISGFSTNLPPGLTGKLAGIPYCPDADIEAARHVSGVQEEASPSCPAASQIGHTLVGTGVGAVLAYVPGKVYLAGPYRGAPFSLVSITSAVVGPFDLGTVVLRFGLNIDPITAQVSVEPTSSEPIPTIIDGIVTHVRDIRVYIDRPEFMLNPTSCEHMGISSTLSSPAGARQTVSSPFQDANCAALAFKPTFKASTSAKTSRKDGASLHVDLTYPAGALGKDANIHEVKVELPKQLPSELKTLQHACLASQFNANPAGCPKESVVGHAKAVTPLLPVPLEGPAYFVSYGGAKFPELVIVLQGDGVTIDLHGETFINEKTGVTSSTFKSVPDQPVGSFELTLPEGEYSALASNLPKKAKFSFCGQKLTMPTLFIAQNGAKVEQKTKVSVTGCKAHKRHEKPQKHANKGKRREKHDKPRKHNGK